MQSVKSVGGNGQKLAKWQQRSLLGLFQPSPLWPLPQLSHTLSTLFLSSSPFLPRSTPIQLFWGKPLLSVRSTLARHRLTPLPQPQRQASFRTSPDLYLHVVFCLMCYLPSENFFKLPLVEKKKGLHPSQRVSLSSPEGARGVAHFYRLTGCLWSWVLKGRQAL